MELWIFAIMIATFGVCSFALKLPIGVAFLFSSIAGALVGGAGVPVRHLVEGAFAYLDAILIIATAMIFMEVIRTTGALGTISRAIILKLHRRPALLLAFVVIFIMFPGLITGLSSACVFTTGALIAPALIALGMPRLTVGAFIAIAGVFGMIGPPINLPVMIIGAGVDMPYVGFDLPLLFTAFPLAIVTALAMGYRHIRGADIAQVEPKLPKVPQEVKGLQLYLPILIVVVLLIAVRVVPRIVPDIGVPLIFVIGSLSGLLSSRKLSLYKITRKGIQDSMEVMALLVGVGMFVQIMALTGARGALAVETLRLPAVLLFLGLGVVMPAFGSAFASATIMGVPVLLALLGYNEIIVASALSLIGGVGDLMPPPTMLCVFSGQIIGEKNQLLILKQALPWIVVAVFFGIMMILSANVLAKFLVL